MIEYGLEWHTLDSYFQFKEQSSAPGTPESGHLRVYAKDKSGTSALYLKDDAGNEREIAPANTVTGTGTANRLAYWSSSSVLAANAALTQGRVMFPDSNGLPTGNSEFSWNDSTKRLLLGPSALGFRLEVASEDNDNSAIVERRASADANPPGGLSMLKSRGTLASPSATQADDLLGGFGWGGHNGTDWVFNGALVRGKAAENYSSTARGTHITLETTPTGSTTRAERVRITADAKIVVDNANSKGAWDITNAVIGLNTTDPNSITTVPGFFVQGNSSVVLQLRAYGTSATPVVLYQAARGTIASPTALQAADNFFAFNCYGQQSTTADDFGLSAQLIANATENFSSTARGSRWIFQTTLTGTATMANALLIENDGSIVLPKVGARVDVSAGTGRVFKVPVDNTDPTGGGGAATGRIAIDVGGNLRYIPYYT